MKFFTKEVKIGLTGIAAVALLVYGINFLKGINLFKSNSSYYVEFENISGLVPSSPVYANGFNVGIVRNIAYNYQKPGHITVEVDLNPQMQIPEGSYAELESEMLGTIKMNLMLNPTTNRMLQPGDTLSGRANNGLMGEAAGLIPKFEALLPKLDSIMGSLNTLLADPALTNTLHNAESITANLKVTTGELNKLLKNDLPVITGNLNTISTNVAAITNNLKEVDYATTIARINGVLDNVKLFTDKLNRTDNSLGLLLNDRSLYDHLDQTAGNAASLLEDLKEHPKRYVHFSIFGKKGN